MAFTITVDANTSCLDMDFTNSSGATIDLSNKTLTVAGNFTMISGGTVTPGTSKMVMNGDSKTFAGAGKTYYDIEFQGTPTTVSGDNTFHDLKLTAAKTMNFTASSTQTITTWSGDGTDNSTNKITIQSTSNGTYYTISCTSGTISKKYYSLKDCHVVGGATFNVSQTFDISGNSGWNITGPEKYWVGVSGGNWSDTSNWADTDNGSSGANVPNQYDNVYFTQYSITSAAKTITVDATAKCKSLDFTGLLNTPTFTGNSSISIYGSLAIISGITWTLAGGTTFKSTVAGNTITTAGKDLASVTFNGVGGSWSFTDNYTSTSSMTLTNGILDFNNKNVIVGSFSSSNSNTRELKLGTGTITVTAGHWECTTSTGLTITLGASGLIKLTGNNYGFRGGSKTYYDVEFTGTPTAITGDNSFHDMKLTAGKTVNVTASSIQTVTTLSGDGTLGNNVVFQSGTASTYFSLICSTGSIVRNYWTIKDCHASGGAIFAAISSTDSTGNTGWVFNKRYWVGGTGNWSDTGHWSYSSGGATGGLKPTPTDNVYFDANSFSGTGQTVTINENGVCLDMIWTGSTNTPTFSSTSYYLDIYGSLTLIADMNISGERGGQLYFYATAIGKTVTTAGKTLYSMDFSGEGGGWTLQDNVTLTSTLSIEAGTLNTNGKSLYFVDFKSEGTGTRVLTLGASTLLPTGDWTVSGSNMTLTAGTSKIWMLGANKNFAGGGKTYNNAEFADNTIVSGNNTFNELKLTKGKVYDFTAGSYQTFTSLSGDGDSSESGLITIQSTSSGTYYTFTCTSGDVAKLYYAIRDCHATGGAYFTSTQSVDVDGNSGWVFISLNFTITIDADTNCLDIDFTNSNYCTINLGPKILNVNGNFTAISYLDVIPGTSTIRMLGDSTTFTGAGKTYHNLGIAGDNVTIVGNNTFADVNLTSGKTTKFTAGSGQTFSTLSGDGVDASHLITIESTENGSYYDFTCTAGTIERIHWSIKDNHAGGGAVYNAIDSVNVSGNTGWSFSNSSTFTTYLGGTQISKIYLGSNELSFAIQ